MFLILFISAVSGFKINSMIDLTHPVDENTISWPVATKFTAKQVYKNITDGGYWYENRDISSSEHSGTHLDAPTHLRDTQGGWSTGDIPLDRLFGTAVKIDISNQSREDIDYRMSVEDILNWEKEHGTIPENSILIVHTGRGNLYTNRVKYLGYPAGLNLPENDTEHLHFPGIGEQAARLLVSRQVKGVGIDTPSLDYGQSKDYIAHRILLGANIWGLENAARTDELPETGFQVYNFVLKLSGGSGGPTRALAILEPETSGSNGRICSFAILGVMLFKFV
ncbi:uncharacterized protein LOC111714553 [Eurytemora carolleeae]|uniref:uncharacterized protein LOC111714553 n=1 Tax=Eurytemora carolleeae TaxID=1294199 RepID=UPI000C792233|nr:uncharacterized protein LOC111714553 [Eurytemora carolleeae]|eukprot:XP_023345492.1 uncharacterized protein LOC111714553 [Eurytemora affinis]